MTNEELLSVAEIVERATNRFNAQAAYHRERFDEHVKLIASMKADHEAKMVEHRAAFGARTEADAKIIAGLREESAKHKAERDHFYQREGIEQKRRMDVEDKHNALRAEVAFLKIRDREYEKALDLCDKEEQTPAECIGSLNARIDRLQDDARSDAKVREELHRINVDLRAEVAALQERLRASIARGDFAQMEVAVLKSQTPQHPVKVGEWVKRLTPSPMTPAGGVAKVTDVFEVHGLAVKIERPDGIKGTWWAKSCEPCDPPIVKREPTIGDTVRLVKIPIMGAVSPELQKVLEWPWMERWGTLNQTALVVEPAYQLEGALSVCLSTNVHVRWPICCVEVVSEATHDTDAGKATAESGLLINDRCDVRKVTT